jgi:two-component system NtrC family sensor kinase
LIDNWEELYSHCHIHKVIFILCLFGSLYPTGRLYSSDTLYIDGNFEQAHAANHAWIYEDKEQDEELGDILNRTFLEHSMPYLNFGFSRSVYWLKIVLKNTDQRQQEVYYQYLNHYLDYVDIFLVDENDSLLTKGSFGARRLQSSYKSLKMNPVYDIDIPPGGTVCMYLRIQSDTPLRIPVVFNSPDSIVKRERKRHVFLGLFYGIAAFSLLLVFSIILITRDRMYLYFLLALVGLILFQLAYDNLLPRWVIANKPAFILHVTTACSMLVAFFYILFTQRFFSQEKVSSAVGSFFNVLKILTIIFFAWYLIDYYSGNKISYFFMPLVMLGLLAISLIYWLSGAKLARFFFWALLIPLAGTILHVLANTGLIYSRVLVIYSIKASYMLQIVVFIIAIADRYLLMQQNFTNLLQERIVERTMKLEETLGRLKSTQQQLVQSEKMASLGTLTSGIALEINNPLNAISGGMHILENNLTDPKPMESARSMIRDGFERTHKIVKALMTFSKSDVEKPVKSDLHEIIDNTLLLVRSRIGDQIRVEKEYRLESTVPVFQGKLHQILLSIIDNAIFAIQHNEEEKEKKDEFIRICTWEVKGRIAGEGQAVIEICNSGPAIPDQHISNIFDPFFTTKDPGEGTGLGLSITYSLVKDHDGDIEVHNVPDGVCFVIKLPVLRKS